MDDAAERVPDDVAAHAAGCPRCSEFSERARRLRNAVRFEVAAPVPDLVPAIMARVEAEAGRERAGAPPGAGRGPGTGWRRAVGLAAAIGLVAGYLVTSGIRGLQVRGGRARAEEIPHR